MSFKKINLILQETLKDLNFEAPLPFQKQILSVIKGGSDAYIVGEKGIGKTTALIIHTINKLNATAFEDSPRALIIVENQQEANLLAENFKKFTANTNLRVYTTIERYDFEKQKVAIYYGQDIVIGTPAFVSKLYFQNAIHLGQIQLFALDDANNLMKNNAYNHILRLTESMDKFQSVIIADKMNTKISNYQNNFMHNARVIQK